MLSREDLLKVKTVLVTPGHDEGKIVRSTTFGADLVVYDLEDSVPLGDKPLARELVAACDLSKSVVRVNGLASDELQKDLEALKGKDVGAIMLPKCESYRDIVWLLHAAAPHGLYPVIALVETPGGVLHAEDIAIHKSVIALAFGQADFIAAMGCSNDALQIVRHARGQVSLSAHAAGIAAIDSPTVMKADAQAHWDAEESRVFGYTAKGCIFPRHIDIARRYMEPAREERAFAERNVNAGDGVTFLEQEQIAFGPPMVKWCQKILERV